MAVEAIHQIVELLFTDVGRRAATKVSKAKLAALKSPRAAVAFKLLDECVEIEFNLTGVLVCIDFEVTKLAALTTEWDVEISQVDPRCAALVKRLDRIRKRIPVSIAKTADSWRQNNTDFVLVGYSVETWWES